MRSIRSTKHLGLIGMLLIAVAFAGLQLTAVTGRASPDTKNYLSYALSLSGESRAEAGRRAIDHSCASQQHGPLDSIPWTSRKVAGESEEQCVRRLNDSVAHWSRNGNTSGMIAPFANHRFMAIFEARPGYPLFLVPFVTVFGAMWGLWLAGLVVALAGSVCVLLTLRCAGASRRAGLAGQALYLALPTGTVAMNPLSDGLSLALGTAVVLGCTLLCLDRPRAGAALVVGGLALMFPVRYSQALLLAAALTAGFALRWAWLRRRRRPSQRTGQAAVLCGALAVAVYAGAHLLSWPTGQDSAQDLLTDHYRRPDLPNPWPEFLVQERIFWTAWLRRQATYPVLPVLLALSAWALLRRRSAVLPIALAAAFAGILNQAGHPNLDQLLGHRLIVFVWLLPVLAVPLLLDREPTPSTGGEGAQRTPLKRRRDRDPAASRAAGNGSSGRPQDPPPAVTAGATVTLWTYLAG
ncbi:hypothetical protein ACFW6N_24505 [Streptomyces cyaneofuscatus]|uniref:hypothetical protein n=1 Tax=Streptomyces TaxID=1883 RepID=UPI000ADB6B8D|nr:MULTISPECIES: hypothetical protein [Streptomyces]CAD5914060.1 conserved membrane protein of unknown function [Streptomyces sp. KY70]CAD5994202.1 conserved membrane protein of unknown function [Streptomyces sp. KY75]